MEILGLSSSPSSGGAYALILNEINGARRLPIIIGTYEAQAIALELEHIKPPRPMTHDLMVQFIRSMDGNIEFVYINALSEGTFYAQIHLVDRGVERVQDARPSDAIALAVRFGCNIYVDDKVLEEAGIVTDTKEQSLNQEEVQNNQSDKESQTNDPLTQQATKAMQEIIDIEKRLNEAIENEDYELAARLRDQLNRLKS